jgi:hypothetical protein
MCYAAGAGDASRYLYANGAGVTDNVSFPNTGSWSSYSSISLNAIPLHSGDNTVSIIYNSSKGSHNWLNLDEIAVTSSNTQLVLK